MLPAAEPAPVGATKLLASGQNAEPVAPLRLSRWIDARDIFRHASPPGETHVGHAADPLVHLGRELEVLHVAVAEEHVLVTLARVVVPHGLLGLGVAVGVSRPLDEAAVTPAGEGGLHRNVERIAGVGGAQLSAPVGRGVPPCR